MDLAEPDSGVGPARWRGPVGWTIFALVALAAPALLTLWSMWPSPPHLARVPDFTLQDSTGASVSRADLIGAVQVIDLIFTRCPNMCPALSAHMGDLSRDLPATPLGGAPIGMVSITVDPEHDRPEVLATYAAQYTNDTQRWRWLTGERTAIDNLVAGLQQGLERAPGGGDVPDIRHSLRFILVDPTGSIRGSYPADQEGLSDLRLAALRVAWER